MNTRATKPARGPRTERPAPGPAKSPRVYITPPTLLDQTEFLAAVARSRRLHRPWVQAPATPTKYRALIERQSNLAYISLLVRLRGSGELVGGVNISNIVRGLFQSAYLGYYAFAPYAGQGLMREGLALAIAQAFGKLKLHRLEANIQPGNTDSRALVKRLGFRLEGYSPCYLKIGGRWRDHERWAVLVEQWSPAAARRRLHAKNKVR